MKAIVYREYGSTDVLRYEDIEKPVPSAEEVLIRVHAASVNPLDAHLMHGVPAFLRPLVGMKKEKVHRPGVDVAGEVESVGASVTHFKPGDAVFGSCKGAFAEYGCASETKLVRKPENITYEQAASAPVAAYTALQGLRDKAHLQSGQRLLVNGAAGGVGTFTVQIGKWLGAEVTAVCSTRNADMVRSIGADRVIDYTRENFTKTGQRYDVIFDLVANHSLTACRRVLAPNGTYVGAGVLGLSKLAIPVRLMAAPVLSRFGTKKFFMLLAKFNDQDLATIRDLMANGKVRPVIERCYKLTEAADAIRHLQTGHARGKIIIKVI